MENDSTVYDETLYNCSLNTWHRNYILQGTVMNRFQIKWRLSSSLLSGFQCDLVLLAPGNGFIDYDDTGLNLSMHAGKCHKLFVVSFRDVINQMADNKIHDLASKALPVCTLTLSCYCSCWLSACPYSCTTWHIQTCFCPIIVYIYLISQDGWGIYTFLHCFSNTYGNA